MIDDRVCFYFLRCGAVHVKTVPQTIDCVATCVGCMLSYDMLLTAEKQHLTGKEGEHGGYQEYFVKHGKHDDPDRVCVLNQHPVRHATTSHSDGSLPTFLSSGNQKVWSMHRCRWLSAVEKFGAMMWPVTEELAKALHRPQVFPRDCNAHERIGNAMHIGNTILVLLSVLSSIEVVNAEPMKAGLASTSSAVPCKMSRQWYNSTTIYGLDQALSLTNTADEVRAAVLTMICLHYNHDIFRSLQIGHCNLVHAVLVFERFICVLCLLCRTSMQTRKKRSG